MVYWEEPLEERVRIGLSMLGWVAETGEIVDFDDGSHDPCHGELLNRLIAMLEKRGPEALWQEDGAPADLAALQCRMERVEASPPPAPTGGEDEGEDEGADGETGKDSDSEDAAGSVPEAGPWRAPLALAAAAEALAEEVARHTPAGARTAACLEMAAPLTQAEFDAAKAEFEQASAAFRQWADKQIDPDKLWLIPLLLVALVIWLKQALLEPFFPSLEPPPTRREWAEARGLLEALPRREYLIQEEWEVCEQALRDWAALARRAHARGCVRVAMEQRLIGRVVSYPTFF